MSDQAPATTPAHDQQTESSSSNNTSTSTASDTGSSSTYAPRSPTLSVATTAVEHEAWRELYPPSPEYQGNADEQFDPPFPDPSPPPSPSSLSLTSYPSSASNPNPPSTTPSYPGTQQEQDPWDDDEDAEADAAYPDPRDMWPIVVCPCPCHITDDLRDGRPWLAFSNTDYAVCPLCWVDAYMTAHGDDTRFFDCERFLRSLGKDPKVPASQQC
ncbi:hypothetical protein F4781DRAFT_428845 [Annulohypoxylon bovei var. microspora]|nr:hypothetical protein F4781DRAFT_428845 [Annulohypoxylon bovei var. microspora]